MTSAYSKAAGSSARAPRLKDWLSSRCTGVLIIASAGCIGCLYHWLPNRGAGDIMAWRLLILFPAFLLAAYGVLLLIEGAQLREEWRRRCFDTPPTTTEVDDSTYAASMTDGRMALASLLALRAIRAAGQSRNRAGDGPDLGQRLRPRPRRRRA